MTTRLDKPRVLVLVGPTAVGKTQLSLDIAQMFDCEIISGDSMQVYRGMDIGSAKATPHERAIVPHHMIDLNDPDYPFSVAEFQERCKRLIGEIANRGKLPFIVGGTGLYIQSVLYNYSFSEGGTDDAYRNELSGFADLHGEKALHAELQRVDPVSAERIHPNDRRRMIRALEIFRMTGKTMTWHLLRQKKESPYEYCMIGLTMNRALLYKRIEDRIERMLQQGLVDEVRGLLRKGYTRDLVSMQGLGYKEIAVYLEGECGLPDAIEWLKRNTRRFAKRQLSWFRHMEEIHWVDVTDANLSTHLHMINDIIAGKFAFSEKNQEGFTS